MFNYSYTHKERTIFLAVLMAAGGMLRVLPMLGYYYNTDEMLHLGIASAANLKQVWEYSLYETHPPLGHFLRHFWMMFGGSIWWNRSLSLIFGLALIPLMYLCGKEASGRPAGMVAAIMTAFVPYAVTASNVARNYSISAFFTAAAMLFIFRYAQDRKPKYFALFALFAVLSALTHYTNIFALFALMGVFAIRAAWSKNCGDMLRMVGLATFLVAVTAFFVFQHGNRVDSYVSATPELTEYLANLSYSIHMAGQAVQFTLLLLISLFASPSMIFGNMGGVLVVAGIFISLALAVFSKEKSPNDSVGAMLLKQAFLFSQPLVMAGAFFGFFGFSLIRRAYSVMQLGTLFIACSIAGGAKAKPAQKLFVTGFAVLIALAAVIAIPQDQRRIEATITENEWSDFTKVVDSLKADSKKNLIYADLPVIVSLLWGRDNYYKFLTKYQPFENAAVYPLGSADVIYRYSDVKDGEAMASLKELLKENPDKYNAVVFILLKASEGSHVKLVRECFPKLEGIKVLMNNDVYMLSVPTQVLKREVILNNTCQN